MQPKIFIKDSSKADVKILQPHPPYDLMKKGPTNFSQLKSPALVSLEHKMREINEKLNQPVNYKKFFWTPDLSVCGFGTSKEIKQTLNLLNVDQDYSDKYYSHLLGPV